MLLGGLEWSSVPFFIEHVLKGTAFFVFATGFFSVAVALTRAAGGYSLDPVRRPLLASSPADFWRRYNRCIGQFLREDVFRPVGGRRRPALATMAAFLVSGIVHEYMFSMAVGSVQGFQLAFFLVQGSAVVLTLRTKAGPIGIVGTWGFNAVTSVLFFASLDGVIGFYEGGLPDWLWGS